MRIALLVAAAVSALLVAAGPALSRTLEVGPDKTFHSIADALKKAKAGDTVEVQSGTYEGALIIKKKITLQGIDSGGGLPVITAAGQSAVLHLTGGGATIAGLVVAGGENPVGSYKITDMVRKDAGILIESNSNTIRDVTVHNLHNGLLIFGADNNVADSAFRANSIVGAGVRSGGGNSFVNSTFDGNGVYGLMLGWFNDPALATGNMQDWYKVLQTLKNVEHNKVDDNSFTNNGFAGLILAQAAFRNEATGNTATGNGGSVPPEFGPWSKGAGIYLSCAAMWNLIAGNDVSGNDNSGITLNPGMDNIFRSNAIKDNTEFGIDVAGSTGNRFEANAISGHKGHGIIFKRWVEAQMPNASNLLTGNDLSENGMNAYDESGVAFEPPAAMQFVDEATRQKTIAEYSVANSWDDGARGNHYDDFDETSEGFVDANGDGIGEMAHPIPGGAAVDHLPLAQAPVNEGKAATDGVKVAALKTICTPLKACDAAALSCAN